MKHEIQRVRHEIRRRTLEVRRVEHVTPQMLRLTLGGAELEGFHSPSPDDHVKIFVAEPDGTDAMRDYTPRAHDAATGELAIDFALHEAGPATLWALNAKPGDAARIGGPRGSVLVPDDFDWWLLVGDETALPAIARRVETLAAGRPVTTIAAVTGPEEEQAFETAADHAAVWVHRPAQDAADPAPLLDALSAFTPPPGEGFVWIAAEGGVARALRAHVLEVMNHPPRWMKASGYWVQGKANTTEKFGETPPPAEAAQ